MTQTQTDGEWRVVRTLRIAADDNTYDLEGAWAVQKTYEAGTPNDGDAAFSVAHHTLPLDSVWEGFTDAQLDELVFALSPRGEEIPTETAMCMMRGVEHEQKRRAANPPAERARVRETDEIADV